MPRGDRTGSSVEGLMTGRRAGLCAGFDFPGISNTGRLMQRYGFRGGGHGWRNVYYTTGLFGWQRIANTRPVTTQGEAEILKEQAEWFTKQLEAINKRLEELNQS